MADTPVAGGPGPVTEDQLLVKDPGAGDLDGTGIVYSANDLAHAKGVWDGLADSAAVGVGAMSVISDPFETALAAGVGWLIEHVSFLREPLDALAGNANAIMAHAQTWQNIAQQLNATAQRRAGDLRSLDSWQGTARDGYQVAATQQVDVIRSSAQAADQLSREVITTGAVIGTVRTLIRDLIARFIAKMVERAVLALAGAIETVGATVAAFIADLVAEGVALAGTIAGKIAELIKVVARSSASVTALAGKVDDLAQGLGQAGRAAGSALPGLARDGVHTTLGQGRAMLGTGMREWAANPPSGVGNVLKGAVTDSAKDIGRSVANPSDFLAQGAAVQDVKQHAKAQATESEWTPL
jgi:uncharacterized protein YukE